MYDPRALKAEAKRILETAKAEAKETIDQVLDRLIG